MAIDTASGVRDYKNYVGGEWVEASSGETFDVINPATEEVIATVPKMSREDAQSAIAHGARDVRLGRVVRAGARRALADHPAGRREVHRARGRAGRAGDRAGGHDDPRHLDGGDRLLHQPLGLLRPRGRPPAAGAARAGLLPDALLQLRAARADRRVRRDHPLELPARDGRVEARAGAGDGQHRRAQAGVEHAADGAAPGRAARRDRPAQGRRQRDHRRRRVGRRGAGLAPRRSTRSRSPARPWSGGGSCSSPPRRSRSARSSWAASRPTSSTRTPTSRPRWTARCGRRSSIRARCASRGRA